MEAKLIVTGNSTMETVLEGYPGVQDALFARFHIGGCATCGYEPGETVAEVARRNGIELEAMVETIRTSQAVEPKFPGKSIPLTAMPPANLGPI